MIINDKYILDFLKFVQITSGRTLKTNVETSEWNIYNPITNACIGAFNPSNGMIRIFKYEMYEIMIDYLQLGFDLDVFH